HRLLEMTQRLGTVAAAASFAMLLFMACSTPGAALSPIGGHCTADSDCAEGWCGDDGCTPKQPNGAACTSDDQCTSGTCTDLACYPLPNGAYGCTTDSDCESHMCACNNCV